MKISFRAFVSYFTVLLLVLGSLFAIVNFFSELIPEKKDNLIFAPKTVLSNTWQRYKDNQLEPGTMRTLDKSRGNITTSEGQSYTMLRAVWIDDKDTFDKSWGWTRDNLQREDDNLFYWLFGERDDGTYGVLVDQGGENTASDADTDIAMALMFAYSRWNDPSYLEEAQKIVQDIWLKEVVVIGSKPYLVAADIEKSAEDDEIVLNPSYFSPYAYRMFAEIDPANDWEALVDTSYEVIEESFMLSLDKNESASIPPDWVAIDRNTGELRKAENHETKFSFDAMRIPWRLALDSKWYKDNRAELILGSMEFFEQEWEERKSIYQAYEHNGEAIVLTESPAIYGGLTGYFIVSDSKYKDEVYEEKIKSMYNSDIDSWNEDLGYYSENWMWFGFAMYHNLLPNLWASAAG